MEDLMWSAQIESNSIRTAAQRIISSIENRDVYLFQSSELERIAGGIEECTELEDLSELMWEATISLHFQNFAIFVLKPGRGASFNPKICTSFNKDWIHRYVEQGYQYVDPVMTRASQSDGWFNFADLDSNAPAIEAFWSDAVQHGIGRNGMCRAITRSDGTRIGVSFSTQDSNENVEKKVRINYSDMECITLLASDAFCFSASGPTLLEGTLTEAEMRFLYVLSTSPNPQDATKVSSGFGSNEALQSSIRRKLGVDTVFQAVAIAAGKGWFDQLPYEANEIVKSFAPLQGLSDAENGSFDLYDEKCGSLGQSED